MNTLTCTVAEAAQMIGIGKGSTYDLVRAGRLPHVRVGRKVLIPRDQLASWLAREAAENTRGPSPQ